MKSAFTDIFVRRPVLAMVVNLVIIIAGIQAISSLTVRQFPRNDNAVIVVNTAYIGANSELVRGFITTPMERAISGADGIDYIDSQSGQGMSTINVHLELNYDPIKALSEITSKVNQVRGDLPPEAEVPVINVQSADSAIAAAYLSFSSEILESNQITDYLVRVVQPRLSALEGVQRADVLGARTYAMRIWLKPDRMAAYGVTPVQIRQALSANNYLAALGSTKGSYMQVNLSANTDLNTVEEFKDLVLRAENGALVRLSDVADVVLGSESYDTEVHYSGDSATFMGIFPMPQANTLDVMALVRTELESLREGMPKGLEATIGYDSTDYIQTAISEVVKTLGETLLIVIAIIFLFLGSVRSVIIPVVAIPVSLIGGIFLMQMFGFSLNLLTLLAIVLSVGLVVDDAIVIVENVERHIANGESPAQAAILGARELVGPVIAMTITLVAVYLPIGLQGGLTGSLFREFAFTLAGAVTISGIVALTLSPMMSAKLLKEGMEDQGFAHVAAQAFEKIRRGYIRFLDVTLKARGAVYMLWIVLSVLAFVMFMQSPKELAPTEDQGFIFVMSEGASSSTIDQSRIYSKKVNEKLLATPEGNFTFQITFPDGGFGGMLLNNWDERDRTVFEILPEVSSSLSQIGGINVFALAPPSLPGGGNFPVEFVIASTAEVEDILEYAEQLQQVAMASGKFAFPPQIDTKVDVPEAQLVIDRDKVADLGLSLQQVGADVGVMLGGGYVNRFNIGGRSYRVIPQVKRSERLNSEQLQDIFITGPEGKLIPLSTVAEIEQNTVPRSLNRFQQLNAVKLSGVSNVSLDEALGFLEAEAARILPSNYMIDYTGESRQLRREGNKFVPAFILSLVLIFLVLAAQFNSFRDPFVILAGSVPLAMFGASIFTFLKFPVPGMSYWTDGWTTTLNIYSQVGLVTLIGLVAKNGILLVEFANKLQEQGVNKLRAVRESASTRLRPILMTTAATVAGHFPLVLVSGAGAEARNSIGLVLVGGMAIGTLFTLFVVPSIYMLIARDLEGELDEVPEDEASLEVVPA